MKKMKPTVSNFSVVIIIRTFVTAHGLTPGSLVLRVWITFTGPEQPGGGGTPPHKKMLRTNTYVGLTLQQQKQQEHQRNYKFCLKRLRNKRGRESNRIKAQGQILARLTLTGVRSMSNSTHVDCEMFYLGFEETSTVNVAPAPTGDTRPAVFCSVNVKHPRLKGASNTDEFIFPYCIQSKVKVREPSVCCSEVRQCSFN